MLLFDIIL